MANAKTGKIAEALFVAEALVRGIVPAWPATEEEPFDFLCWTGKRTLRVQVKGTQRAGSVSLNLNHSYTIKDIDFLVVHHFKSLAWYVIPVSKLKGRNLSIMPAKRSNQWDKYIGAWELLK